MQKLQTVDQRQSKFESRLRSQVRQDGSECNMTIAISIKVNDGLVLATDSASTIYAPPLNNQPSGVINVYQNAEKLFNLCKGKPIGAITWGSGSIGQTSISTLIKDYRTQIKDPSQLNSIEGIANDLAQYVNVLYNKVYAKWPEKPSIGFMVAGYSKDAEFAELWKFEIIKGVLINPFNFRKKEEVGMTWNGEPEAISRLCLGFSPNLERVLTELQIENELIEKILGKARENLTVPFAISPMPIKDAIDLAEYLVSTTINFVKFSPGAPTVGGPIDIAAITKHEGFKWIKRKYYYNVEINPKE